MRNITIKDVAKEAGVSISSVSRYLADPNSINQIAAVSVGTAIRKLNYVPNPYAQNLKKGSSNIIAVIIPDISNDFFSRACKAMGMLFFQNKYLLMICNTDDDDQKERFYIEEMLRIKAAGIMIASSGRNSDFLKHMIKSNRNILLFDRMDSDLEVSTICEDNVTSGYELVNYMINKGHHHFSILAGSDYSVNTNFRLTGIKRAFEENNIAWEDKYLYRNITTYEDAIDTVCKIVADKSAPKCIIACNPKIMQGVAYAVNKCKLNVPEELILCGYCIDNPAQLYSFPVTAIVQDPTLVGLKSGEQMLKILKSRNKNRPVKKIFVDHRLVY